MTLIKVLDSLRVNKNFMSQVVAWNRIAARPAETVAMRDVDYTLTTNTGSSQLAAAVNLDEDAEPEP